MLVDTNFNRYDSYLLSLGQSNSSIPVWTIVFIPILLLLIIVLVIIVVTSSVMMIKFKKSNQSDLYDYGKCMHM